MIRFNALVPISAPSPVSAHLDSVFANKYPYSDKRPYWVST